MERGVKEAEPGKAFGWALIDVHWLVISAVFFRNVQIHTRPEVTVRKCGLKKKQHPRLFKIASVFDLRNMIIVFFITAFFVPLHDGATSRYFEGFEDGSLDNQVSEPELVRCTALLRVNLLNYKRVPDLPLER